MECLSWLELSVFDFLLSRRDLHATCFVLPKPDDARCLYFLTLLKVGCAGLSFWFLARTFKIPRWGHVALSVSYASISFITAHSEIIMWLDAFVYLPLIILGIHRVMDLKKPIVLFVSYLLIVSIQFLYGLHDRCLFFLILLFDLTNWSEYKKTIVPYGITSLLAGGASMIIILPASWICAQMAKH